MENGAPNIAISRSNAILALLRERKSCTTGEIADIIGTHRKHICRYLKPLLEQEKIAMCRGLVWLKNKAEYLTKRDIARRLGLSFNGVRAWQRRGILKRPESKRQLSKEDLLEFLGRVRVGPPLTDLPTCMTFCKTVRQFALHPCTLEKWRKRGLPYFQIQRTILLSTNEVAKYARQYISKHPPYQEAHLAAERLQKTLQGMNMPAS